jgi:hypothetical protein
MTKATITRGVSATMLVLLGGAAASCSPDRDAAQSEASPSALSRPNAGAHQGLLYGRVSTDDGDVYEGRLRFGRNQETLWGSYFNGFKADNPWADDAPREQLPGEHLSFKLFGVEIALRPRPNLGRPFMARFGDIARLEARGRDLWVTLKSGTVFHLNRYAADDYADGLRVWDVSGDVVDLTERKIRSIDFLATAQPVDDMNPLHGTVRTRDRDFTGSIEWDRVGFVGSDRLDGQSEDGEVSLRFDAIRSIARSREVTVVTLLDGREVVLSQPREGERQHRGLYVDDPRYGRVLISWDAFERVDFGPGGTILTYDDFRPGAPLTGTVVTRSGRRLTGRLVYDLDESETTETLDAPSQGVDYTIPFGLIVSIEPVGEGGAQGASVTLYSGEQLQLERAGDLAELNAGVLIFPDAGQSAEYVPWSDVEQIDFDRPTAM